MLSDGVSTYIYNYANRLTNVTGTDVSSFIYNGLGDRYQQIVNGTTTTYQLDLAAGLVQVLADGENTYLYGNTVVAQISETQTGYYLPDVLGSVRQMVDDEANLQLAQSFTPFGEELEKFGDAEANFGYTGQKYDTQTGLLYLRARYYTTGSGRFISKDTWRGNFDLPTTLNRWNYVGSDPINNIDPSGHLSPSWCQYMSTEGMYELCVDSYYGIEPMDYHELGKYVKGKKGCYEGPAMYRAPAYIEGFGITTAAIPANLNWLYAIESVYNFATMEHAYFVNGTFSKNPMPGAPGAGISDFSIGISAAEYAGYAFRLSSPDSDGVSHFVDEYGGPVVNLNLGVGIGTAHGVEAGLSVGIGITPFVSPTGVMGVTTYYSGSIGLDPLPVFDIGVGALSMVDIGRIESYVDDDHKVNKVKLALDISYGRYNFWSQQSGTDLLAIRGSNAALAMNYAQAYEELHE
ncbi:MAG: RHS repeat-associated core domain-containing protein [Anaerolineaceae bacterium]|nr:RHS repeat-associated core domain-containing protein [Anaerolineaceae bacterium]